MTVQHNKLGICNVTCYSYNSITLYYNNNNNSSVITTQNSQFIKVDKNKSITDDGFPDSGVVSVFPQVNP